MPSYSHRLDAPAHPVSPPAGIYRRIVEVADHATTVRTGASGRNAWSGRHRLTKESEAEARFGRAARWWQTVFEPEFETACDELHRLGLQMFLDLRFCADDRRTGSLRRAIAVERVSQRSKPYLVSVNEDTVSLRVLGRQGWAAIDGYRSGMALAKLAPGPVTVMISHIVKHILRPDGLSRTRLSRSLS